MKAKINLVILILLSLISVKALANDEREKMYLIQIINQLDALRPLVISAAKEEPKNKRILFHYTSYKNGSGELHNGLLEDINELRKGIKAYLEPSLTEPRYFQSIKGDYLIHGEGNAE